MLGELGFGRARAPRRARPVTANSSTASGVRAITIWVSGTHSRIASARGRGTRHAASANSARRAISLTSCDQRAVRAIGVIATTRSMRAGWLTAHCSACMPPIDAPTTAARRPMPSCVEGAPLRLDHVADRDRGEAGAAAGECCSTASSTGRCRARRSTTMRKRSVSSGAPGPIRKSSRWCVLPMAVSARIAARAGPGLVAVHDGRDEGVVQDLARLERQLADVEAQVRPVDPARSERRMAHGGASTGLVEHDHVAHAAAFSHRVEALVDARQRQPARRPARRARACLRGRAAPARESRAAAGRRRSSSGRCASRPSASRSAAPPGG